MSHRPTPYQKLVHRFLMLKPVSVLLARVLHHMDILLLRLSRNRCTFAGLAGLPIALLQMKGARTGTWRALPLVAIPMGSKYALIATNFGQKHHPGWYYNLKAHPVCELSFKGRSQICIAREVSGEEYKTYWDRALSYYAGYEKYRERAAPRSIPILILEPEK